jgi:hypothetical protein
VVSGFRRLAPALCCGLLALLLASLAMTRALAPAGWSLTVLPRVDSETRLGTLAQTLEPGFRTVHPGAYDGQFYWGIAVDPLATGELHGAFDKASYRYGHPLYGWLGWLLSAGYARAAAAGLAAAALLSVAAAAVAASTLAVTRRRSAWIGLFVAFSPGLMVAASNDLAEPLAVALLLGGLAFYLREQDLRAWICLSLLPLTKEQLVLAPLAVAAYELHAMRRVRALRFSAAILPALAWWTYTRVTLGAWFTTGDSALGRPLAGWWRALADARTSWLAEASTTAVIIVLLAVLGFAFVRAFRLRGPVELCYLALSAVAICLAPNATTALSTALRNTAFLLALAPFILLAVGGAPRPPRTSSAYDDS